MSEENQQQNVSRETAEAPNVSRETSGAPIEAQRSGFDGERRDGEADELSPKAEASERSSSRRVSRETTNTPKKRSSFFVYLAVLFGAAFLMLLLAYFVQQRNNQTTITGLQDSWNLSREELVEQIEALKEEKEGLLAQREELQTKAAELEEAVASLDEQVAAEHRGYVAFYDRAEVLRQFVLLEQALREQDWDTAAKRVRALCSGSLELDMARIELPGEPVFDPWARLAQVIPLLEKRGALEPGEVAIPDQTPPN